MPACDRVPVAAADLTGTGVESTMTVPWLPLLAIGATGVVLTVAAALAGPVRRDVRRDA